MKPPTYFLLGRNGDIINLLPVLKAQSDKFQKPIKLIVAEAFAPLLEGVSYVEPVIWKGHFSQGGKALAHFKATLNEEIVVCSTYAADASVTPVGWTFDRAIWIRSKFPAPPHSLPLVFDKRDAAREQLLVETTLPKTEKPVVLTSLAGESSPFGNREEFLRRLEARLPGHDVIDISNLRAHRLFDLLGLYEKALALVATDSAPLHLAAATPKLTTIALVTDGPTPWHQSSAKPHHALRVPYSKAMDRLDEIAFTISAGPEKPRLIFVAPDHSNGDAAAQTRISFSRLSTGPRLEPLPARPAVTGERFPLPFVRDLINEGFKDAKPNDIVILINSDIVVVPGVQGLIEDRCREFGCCFAHRWDFSKITRVPVNEEEIKQGRWYAGSDLFAFTKTWWEARSAHFPDMLVGREGWDMVMRNLMKRSVDPANRSQIELHKAIVHERHASLWEAQKNLGGNAYNRALAHAWLQRHGGDWDDWKLPAAHLNYR